MPCGLILSFTAKSPLNKGGPGSPQSRGGRRVPGTGGGEVQAGQGLQADRAAPGVLAPVGRGSCPLPWAGPNQPRPSGMELPRRWHRLLIRRDPAPGWAAREKAAGKIQFELARQLPARGSPEEELPRAVAAGPAAVPAGSRGLPESHSHQPRAPDSSLGTHPGKSWTLA